jgi:hypothetical protein
VYNPFDTCACCGAWRYTHNHPDRSPIHGNCAQFTEASKTPKEHDMKPADYTKYKIRTCNTLHRCMLCRAPILFGDQYYDGGYRRRAHKTCVEQPKQRSTP